MTGRTKGPKVKAILAALLLTGSVAFADTYYCDLKNVPAVREALEEGLKNVHAADLGVTVAETSQFPISGMGDAFDYWGWDMIVYQLDGLGLNNTRSIGVRVYYTSFDALEAAAGEDDPTVYECADTGEIMPARVYIDSKENPILAMAVMF